MSWRLALSQIVARPWLRAIDPRVKLAWLAAVSLGSVTLKDTEALALLAVATAVPYLGMRMPWRAAATYMLLVLLVVWGTVYAQALFYPSPEAGTLVLVRPFTIGGWQCPGVRFSAVGAQYGAAQSLRFVANLLAGGSVCLSTSAERLMLALVKIRVPASIAYLAMAALASLPRSLEEFASLRQAYHLRRGRVQDSSRFGALLRIGREWRLIEPLLANTLRRASQLSLAVRARGFEPGRPRTTFPPLVMRPWERLACCVLALPWTVVFTMAAWRAGYWLTLYFGLAT